MIYINITVKTIFNYTLLCEQPDSNYPDLSLTVREKL